MDTETELSATTPSEKAFEDAPPEDIANETRSTNNEFAFIDLPTEIRLLIYKELLVRKGGAKLSFCLDDHHKAYNRALKIFIHPAILRTCKAVYNEASSILYTDNIFELLCVFLQIGKSYLWYRTWGSSPLLPCPNPRASTDLKRVCLTYIGIGLSRSDIAQFPRCWPKIEQEVLELCPNVHSIYVHIRQRHDHSIYIKLARRQRSKHATTVRNVPDCKAVLEDIDLQQKRNGKGSDPAPDIQDILADLCTEIIQHEGQGLMKDTVFAVHAVRWGRFPNIHPSWEDLDVCDVYLGFARQSMNSVEESDDTVEESDDTMEDSDDSVQECSAQRF